jgi:DNA-binding MarR family transcriptional regulator
LSERSARKSSEGPQHDFTNFDPAGVLDEAEGAFARQMLHIYRAFNALAVDKYARRGYHGLTPAHVALLARLDPAGIRIVDLAARLGLTKQFTGRIVQELAKIEYVMLATDPTDRRVTRVRGTPAGWQFLLDACEVRAEIEILFRDALGESRYAALTEAIGILAALNIDTSGTPEPLDQLNK